MLGLWWAENEPEVGFRPDQGEVKLRVRVRVIGSELGFEQNGCRLIYD